MLRKESALLVLSTSPDPTLDPTTSPKDLYQSWEQDLLSLMIRNSWRKTVSSDTQTINSLKETLATMLPDQTKRVQGERRIQSAANRSTFRANKPKQPARKKQNADSKDFELLKVKINALTTLFKVFSKSENKGRVALYIGNCLFYWLFLR